jgi:hypothetical protein
MTKPIGAKRKAEGALRRQWLREEAPFRVIEISQLEETYFSRKKEWIKDGITHCVIGKNGYPWAQFGGRIAQIGRPEEYASNLNDESLLAIMTEGTAAEKLI